MFQSTFLSSSSPAARRISRAKIVALTASSAVVVPLAACSNPGPDAPTTTSTPTQIGSDERLRNYGLGEVGCTLLTFESEQDLLCSSITAADGAARAVFAVFSTGDSDYSVSGPDDSGARYTLSPNPDLLDSGLEQQQGYFDDGITYRAFAQRIDCDNIGDTDQSTLTVEAVLTPSGAGEGQGATLTSPPVSLVEVCKTVESNPAPGTPNGLVREMNLI